MADGEVRSRELLVSADELNEAMAEGQALEFYPEDGGPVTLLGIERVIRSGREVSIAELHADGQIHRGRLVPNQIVSGSRITIKNSGGKHQSPVLGNHEPDVTSGESFRADFRASHTPRKRARW